MKQSQRSKRVAELFKAELATMLMREIKDPRVQGLVTIMRVEIGSDLRLARVFVGVYGDEQKKKQAMKGLKNAKGYIRSLISKRIYLRRCPDIEFKLDNSFDAQQRISQLLDEIKTR